MLDFGLQVLNTSCKAFIPLETKNNVNLSTATNPTQRLFPTSDSPGEQARPRNGMRSAVPVQQPAAAEERGAGMPRRRRRDMVAGMANRRQQRDVADYGRHLLKHWSLLHVLRYR